jgi:ArsR family transcriptional regulator
MNKNKENIEKLYGMQAAILKAMAHPTRLFILNALKKKELCVCELTEMIGDDISTVSKHLHVLKNAGLVNFKRRGNTLFYYLLCPCVLDFTKCVLEVKKIRRKVI